MAESRDINRHLNGEIEYLPWYLEDNFKARTGQLPQSRFQSNRGRKSHFQDQRAKAPCVQEMLSNNVRDERNGRSREIVYETRPHRTRTSETRPYHPRANEIREHTHNTQETRLYNASTHEMAPHNTFQKIVHDTSSRPAMHEILVHQTRIPAIPVHQAVLYQLKPHEIRAQERNHEMAQHSRYSETKVFEPEEVKREKKWYEYFNRNPVEYLLHEFHRISRLKEIDVYKPHAQFKCLVCGYSCDSLYVVATHIEGPKHLRALQNYFNEYTLSVLPPVPRSQIDVISVVLEKVIKQNALTESHCQERLGIVDHVNKIVKDKFPDCSVHLYGSSLHGMGLRVSDVNMDLIIPFYLSTSKIFEDIFELLQRDRAFRHDIQKSCDWEYPHMKFLSTKYGVECNLRLHNDKAFALASLLKKYAAIDERVCKLAALVKLWSMESYVGIPEEGTLPGYCMYLLVIYYLQQMPEPVLPVLNELYSDDPTKGVETLTVLGIDCCDIKNKWTTKNTQTLGELWIGFFKFYSVDCKPSDYVICITKSEKMGPSPLNRFFFIEPLQSNKIRVPTNKSHFNYVVSCIKSTYRYFSIPQTDKGPIFGSIKEVPSLENLSQEMKDFLTGNISSWLFMQKSLALVGSTFIKNTRLDPEELKKQVDIFLHSIRHPGNLYNFKIEETAKTLQNAPNPEDINVIWSDNTVVFPEAAAYLVPLVNPKKLQYEFRTQRFTNGRTVPPFCEICKKDGHYKEKCAEGMLCRLLPLAPPDPKVYQTLDILCQQVYEKNMLSEEEILLRDGVILELESYIKKVFKDGKLTLFGSSRNGFCTKESDLDICLTLENNETGKGLDLNSCLDRICQYLEKNQLKQITELVHIATAKVPIVKFKHVASQLVGDFSMYNTLGQENSKLLKAYADIDKRAVILGIMMKRFAKECCIGNASKGTLSSYAYTLMVIYFLQRCNTPVLPVLQELSVTPGPLPEKITQGWNTYFFNDLDKLPEVWPEFGKNNKSVGHLWLELLCFYTEQFDPMTEVVCIRKYEKVNKIEARWNSRTIAIEDPFELSHNLGATISRKANIYIFQALQKGRNHFASLPTDNREDIQGYYFNRNVLTEGDPPCDRNNLSEIKLASTVGAVLRLMREDNNKYSPESSLEEKFGVFRNLLEKELNSDSESIGGHSDDKEVFRNSSRSDAIPVSNFLPTRVIEVDVDTILFPPPTRVVEVEAIPYPPRTRVIEVQMDTISYPPPIYIPWHFENPAPLVTNAYRPPSLHPYRLNEEENRFQSSIPVPFGNASTNREYISQNNLQLTYQRFPLANNFPILKHQQDNLQGLGPRLSTSTEFVNRPRPFVHVPLDAQTPPVQNVHYSDFIGPNRTYSPLMQTQQNYESVASNSSSFIKQQENFQYSSSRTDDKTANVSEPSSSQTLWGIRNVKPQHLPTPQSQPNEMEREECWRKTIAKLCNSYEAISAHVQPAGVPYNNTDFSNLNSRRKITPDMKYVNEVERQVLGRRHDQSFIKDKEDQSDYKIP